MAESQHFREARKMFVEVEHPGLGKLKVTNLPINMSETQPVMRKSAPELGENNEAVLESWDLTRRKSNDFGTAEQYKRESSGSLLIFPAL